MRHRGRVLNSTNPDCSLTSSHMTTELYKIPSEGKKSSCGSMHDIQKLLEPAAVKPVWAKPHYLDIQVLRLEDPAGAFSLCGYDISCIWFIPSKMK